MSVSVSEVLHLSLHDIREPPSNARKHGQEQIDQIISSIETFGFINPLILDETDTVLAGHGRLLAALQIGMDSVPCLRVEGLSPEQKTAFALADNRIALNSEWDEKRLAEQVQALLEDPAFGSEALNGFGFGRDDLVRLDMLIEEELSDELSDVSSGPGFDLQDMAEDEPGQDEPSREPSSQEPLDAKGKADKQEPSEKDSPKPALFSVYMRREEYAEITDLIFQIKQDQGIKDSTEAMLYALRTVCQ